MLLRFKTVHVHRQLSRRDYLRQENKFPTGQLRPIAKIEVFTQCIVLPPTSFHDTRASPKASRAVEIKKTSAAAACRLLEEQVAIKKHRLHAGEERVATIQVAPARLDHSHIWIGEKMDRALEQIWFWDKIRIQDAEKLAIGRVEPDGQRACFKSGSIQAANQLDIETAPAQLFSARGGDFARIVGGIIQHLDLQQFSRIIEFTNGAEQTLDHVDFIENWQLHRHLGQLGELSSRLGSAPAVFQKQVDDEIAMYPVGGKAEEDGQIAERPNDMTDTSLHKGIRNCRWLRQHGRMMALPLQASNQKLARLPLKNADLGVARHVWAIWLARTIAAAPASPAEEQPLRNEGHEHEEVGLNS